MTDDPATMVCSGCDRPIPEDEPYMSLNYHIERFDTESVVVDDDGDTTLRRGSITVDHAEMLLTTCIDCTPSRAVLVDALRSAGLPVPPEDES